MRYLLFAFLFLSTFALFAQGVDPVPPGSAEVPIDGGIFGLLAAGAIYGFKKLSERKDGNPTP